MAQQYSWDTEPLDTSAWGVPAGTAVNQTAPVAVPGSTFSFNAPEKPGFATGEPAPGSYPTPPPETQSPPPTPPPPTPTPPPPPAPTFDYAGMMTQINAATDPVKRESLRDQLSRNVAATLTGAGHVVKWEGSFLMVDGRPYVVGQGNTTGTTDTTGSSGTTAPEGFEQGKWDDPNNDSAKYIVSRSLAPLLAQIRAIPDEAGRKAFVEQHLRTLIPQLEAAGWKVLDVRGEKIRIEGHDVPAHWADAIVDVEGAATSGWSTDLPEASQAAGGGGEPGLSSSSLPGAVPGGYSYAGGGASGLGVPAPTPTALGADPGPTSPIPYAAETPYTPLSYTPEASTVAPYTPGADNGPPAETPYTALSYASDAAPTAAPYTPTEANPTPATGDVDMRQYAGDWTPGTGPGYTPGEIPTDTPNFSFDDVFDKVLEGTTAGDAERKLVEDILAHPETYDPQTIETLKARAKDELAAQQTRDDEEMKATGALGGISDSRWLASERNAGRRARDLAVVNSNREVDLRAAEQNTADRRAAAGVGLSYTTAEQAQRQAAMSTALDTVFRSNDAKQSRLAFVENTKQEAARLGIAEDQVHMDWIKTLSDVALRNRAITSDELGRAMALAQTDKQFAAELAYRFADLAQKDKQFGAAFNQNEQQFAASLSQKDRQFYTGLSQNDRQFAASYGLDALKLQQQDEQFAASFSQNERQFEASLTQKDRQFYAGLGQNDRQFYASLTSDERKFFSGLAQNDRQFYAGLSSDERKYFANLGQNDRQFYAGLSQQDRQFAASYGLDLIKTQHSIDQDMWERDQTTVPE